ncbi:MAG: hypothetical protein IPJ84_05010 [Bdellovibrionales bacterium]|nr:hypothetical protein [Bdellovibrionales bacterium]
MSIFGSNSSSSSHGSQTSGQYGRADLQSAFNWLINQPEHIRKQATDPDRLMTLFYRSQTLSQGRQEPQERMETAAPVSSQNFISDLRQINEAMRQFDGPAMATPPPMPAFVPTMSQPNQQQHMPATAAPVTAQPMLHAKTLAVIAEVREKMNLGSDAEAINLLVSIGAKAVRPLLG